MIKELKSEIEKLNDGFSKKDKELLEVKDLMIRRQADFENFKKRMQKNSEQEKKMSIKNIALDILEINDNLIRASEAAVSLPGESIMNDTFKSYVNGVIMISKSIESMLGKYGILEIPAQDSEFDPNLHEAVEINTSPEVNADTVTKVYQKGFCFDEFVLRNSKVCVTKPEILAEDCDQEEIASEIKTEE